MTRLGGFDVSYGRASDTVCVVWDYDQTTQLATITNVIEERILDQPSVIEFVAAMEAKESFDAIAIDAIGFGRGVYDHLMQRPFANKVNAFIASTKASREWEDDDIKLLHEKQFANFKTRVIYEMRKNAYRGKVKIRNYPRLVSELGQYKLMKVGGRWKIEDPKVSPDVADAAVAGYSLTGEFMQEFWLGS
jgi:hypothetical protein